MALFTGRDKDLPILTQFYQVSVPMPSPEDLQRANESYEKFQQERNRTTSLVHDEYYPHGETSRLFGESSGFLYQTNLGGSELEKFLTVGICESGVSVPITVTELDTVAKLHRNVVKVMDAYADDSGLDTSFWQYLSESFRPTSPEYHWVDSWWTPERKKQYEEARKNKTLTGVMPDFGMSPTPEIIRPSQLRWEPINPVSSHQEMIEAIKAAVRELFSGQIHTKRCMECNSVFVKGRSDNRFCSQRCGNRIARRRSFRREKRNEKFTV